MKRKALVFALILCVVCVFGGNAMAVDVEESLAEELELDRLEQSLPEDAAETMDGLSVMESLDVDEGMSRIISSIKNVLGRTMKSSAKNGAAILLIALLCSMVSAVFGVKQDYTELAAVLAIAAIAVTDAGSFITMGSRAIDELNTFSKMLLPTLTACAAAGGAVTSAAAKYAATVMFLDIMISAVNVVIMPLIYAYLAASVAGAALGGEGLSGAAGLIRWICVTVLTVIVIAFTSYLSITGIVSSTADASAVKAAKFTISASLPVVGGMISDAADALLSGAGMVKNAVGIFGLLTVSAVCITPFVHLGINYLIYKAAAGLSSTIAGGRISKLIGSIGTAFGMTLGVVGASAIMLYISIISVIKAVV